MAGAPSTAQSEAGFGTLQGKWVRPDGGYVITVKSVDANGKLDAAYANPKLSPEDIKKLQAAMMEKAKSE